MRVSLIEQYVHHYPPGMENFRMFRIEYAGHAEACLCEGVIWLPKDMSVGFIEAILESGTERMK